MKIRSDVVSKYLLFVNVFVALFYITWWFNFDHMGNPLLYALLVVGEVYHVLMAFFFWYTIYPRKKIKRKFDNSLNPSVDIFVTVAGEPTSVVRKTVKAARDIDYDNHNVYILNDGYVAKKRNWRAIERLAKELGVSCITRKTPGGAKAGNINNALRKTKGEFVVIFDADMISKASFLQKTIGYFVDKKMGFVQTPQYYSNHKDNDITQSAWDQQELFFGPIMRGKDTLGSSFICGTNVVIRRRALESVGGVVEDNIAEDFLTSLQIHEAGWKSAYVPDVLATGLAPHDLLSYSKQQFRWARGSLEVLFGNNPFKSRSLSLSHKIQYISSALFYLNGIIVLVDALIPLVFLFTGITPVAVTTFNFALYFIPFITLTLYTLNTATGSSLSFAGMSYTQSCFMIHTRALTQTVLKKKATFAITPKQKQSGNFLFIAYPHLIYIALGMFGTTFALMREGVTPSVMANVSWIIFNAATFMPFIFSAFEGFSLFKNKTFHLPFSLSTQ